MRRRQRLEPNVILIVGDDMGVNMVGAYQEASDPPCTPALNTIAQDGMLFRNAWATPLCKSTRATYLTGRYGYRTGIGEVGAGSLPLSEDILPEVLTGYDNASLGKWHVGNGVDNPNQAGFDHYAGALTGLGGGYDTWDKTVNGQTSTVNIYNTIDTANDAVTQIGTLQEPFFLHVAFHAPHTPVHTPPAELLDCPIGPNPGTPGLTKAMVEAMDHEIQRILDVVDFSDTYVIFLGDNGTARSATEAPFDSLRAKGSIYEGGVNVPLMVKGPGVLNAECSAIVSAVDLFATIGDLAGVTSTAEDSVSMVPYFFGATTPLRATVYTERFSPNGSAPPHTTRTRAIHDGRWKLIEETGEADELYDLSTDPFEDTDLVQQGMNAEQLAAYNALKAAMPVP